MEKKKSDLNYQRQLIILKLRSNGIDTSSI